ncbi:bifunctional DNA-formamidopyrimidine glycosylase/DNA-(apurinic or apyrimidinic site) lyase [Cryobacterium psychrophilum]|uniref:Bifunctional DNA-formamidopyrimidine glycosylase/DNA-(Apurinic or apyrimidinic site) lyase n=1 Tax=Cryobacterium psychrophilum TaxID=41988 RepID=A0A4Y8KN17_9MICO|nr:bifunctional DNA-formamidopyrimidine glycosylase/DNA-(apurinic or apyrimidinic site) lyase [Cryobacterium psychrophilum]TDW31198.1 formamidopyrimidine-DNA glycosylase [Cryobacterium psychrophilum]TFD78511.1 bifunctional DNA-formamidopyrimidine glycosylase/DNA-(apurinic or apyrimidinic site) lyase [Cryobacterium psychrophilum]
MPELPEVEVVRAGVEPAVTGALVAGVEIFDERSLRRHDRRTGSFTEQLTGRRILGAVRRGKFLWLPLDSGRALVVHLGMSGQVLLRTPGSAIDRHLRIRLCLESVSPQVLPPTAWPDDGAAGELWFDFVDQRVFGSLVIDNMVPTTDGAAGGFAGSGAGPWSALVPSQVAHISRDPIDPAFSQSAFFAGLARKKTGIKRALLDQTLISGIGNIYADEALFAAGLHYKTPTASLSPAQAAELLAALRAILQRALGEGGTSFDSQYVNVNGQSGYFAHSLEVYGRQGTPCSRCGTTLVRESFMNRGSHLCPSCQVVTS